MRPSALCLLLALALSACSAFDGDDGLQDPSLGQLRAAPVTLALGDQDVVLRTFMWRNFQPVSPPDGKPLIALFWAHTTDETALPSGLAVDAVWVINGDDVWAARPSDEATPPSEQRPDQAYAVARGGPKWGPQIEVDAVVRVRDADGAAFLLRAPAQPIVRTD